VELETVRSEQVEIVAPADLSEKTSSIMNRVMGANQKTLPHAMGSLAV
jgi:hypothetical protein